MSDIGGTEGMSDELIENAETAHEWARPILKRLDPNKLAQALWIIGLSDAAITDLDKQLEESVRIMESGPLPPRMTALLYSDMLPHSLWLIKVALVFNAHSFTKQEAGEILMKIARFEKRRDSLRGEVH